MHGREQIGKPEGSIFRMRIHNHDTAPAERLDHWNELTGLTRYGSAGMPEIRGERTFAADYTGSWFGDTGVVAGEMDGGVFVMDRGRTEAVDSGRVQLMLTGNTPHLVDLGSDRREIPPRSVILQFNSRPRTTLRPAHDHMLFVDIDAARLTVAPEILRRACFTALPVDTGLVELFAQAAMRLLAGPRHDPQAAGNFLVSLVDLVVRNAFSDELALTETMPARRVQALRVMQDNLSNAEFSAENLAAALNISRRSLFQLFDDGDPPMSVLRRMRTAFAKDILSDPAQDILTMDQIAKMCGFRTARGLGIAFQREFGRAPSDYRRIRPAAVPDGSRSGRMSRCTAIARADARSGQLTQGHQGGGGESGQRDARADRVVPPPFVAGTRPAVREVRSGPAIGLDVQRHEHGQRQDDGGQQRGQGDDAAGHRQRRPAEAEQQHHGRRAEADGEDGGHQATVVAIDGLPILHVGGRAEPRQAGIGGDPEREPREQPGCQQ